jgi:hypothetical protein
MAVAWLASATNALAEEAGPPGERDVAGVAKSAGGKPGPTETAPVVPAGPETPEQAAAKAAAEHAAAARAADDEALRAEIKALHDALDAQKAMLDAMAAELGAEREQRAEEVVAVQEKSEKDRLAALDAVGFSGYLQADWNAWHQTSRDELNQSNGNLLNDNRFLIRRARLRASLDREYAAGVLEFDGNTVNGATARIIDAEASLKIPGEPHAPPLAMLTIGLFKIPFGFEVLQSDRDRLFMERSVAERALFPGEFDVGVRLMGGWQFVRYAIAVQNGEPVGEKATWPGRDPNNAKDVTGRLGVETPLGDGFFISAGVSGLSGKGFHPGTPSTKTTVQWNDRNQNGQVDPGEITAVPGMAAFPSQNFTRFGYGADLLLALTLPGIGTTTLYGEVYLAQDLDRGIVPADPFGTLSRDMREIGAYGALTQQIGSKFAVGIRYDYYNPDRDSADPARVLVPTSFAFNTLSLVAGAFVGPARFTIEYDYNRNHQGRDVAGNPTNLASDTVVLRGQVAF